MVCTPSPDLLPSEQTDAWTSYSVDLSHITEF
jgi:hypothetical protein